MKVKELREKLAELDWCDDCDISVIVNGDEEACAVDSISDFSSQTHYVDGTKSAVSQGCGTVLKNLQKSVKT